MANTLLDIAKRNSADSAVGLIDEAITGFMPELKFGAARSINGLNYKTLVRTDLPTVAFRNANEGSSESKGKTVERLVETYIMNPQWTADKAVADRSEDGAAAYMADEADAIITAALKHLQQQFYYGVNNDAKGFAGIKSMVESDLVVDAQGSGSDTTEFWVVNWGNKNVRWVLGNGGSLDMTDPSVIRMLDSNNKAYSAYWQEMLAYVGLQIGSKFSVGCIKNIDSGKPLTDNLIGDLITKFRNKGLEPEIGYCTPTALKYLQQSRTATNPTGAAAPFPGSSLELNIQTTLGISDTVTAW